MLLLDVGIHAKYDPVDSRIYHYLHNNCIQLAAAYSSGLYIFTHIVMTNT